MDWSSAGPLWQRQSAGESRWARTEAVGEGRATSPTSLQPRVTQMYQLLMQLASFAFWTICRRNGQRVSRNRSAAGP